MSKPDRSAWRRRAPAAASQARADQRTAFQPASRKNPELTLESALSLQQDLRSGFDTPTFQRKLEALQRKHPKRGAAFTSARSELFLEVQSSVLPKYGYGGTHEGVVDMLAAAARWNDNEQFRKNRDSLNRLLGLDEDGASRKQELRSDTGALGSHSALSRLTRADISSAHEHLLGRPLVLQMNIPKPEEQRLSSSVHSRSVRRQKPEDDDDDKIIPEDVPTGGQKAIEEKEVAEALRAPAGSKDPCAPHGDCSIVGTWDDFSGKHEMMWDGSSYRVGMNLQGMREVSFLILAHDSADSRIYPSVPNARPGIPHKVLGPDGKTDQLHWTVKVERGSENQSVYEIALHCPPGRPMYIEWDQINLDSTQWYATQEH